jgi:hypothetical protein
MPYRRVLDHDLDQRPDDLVEVDLRDGHIGGVYESFDGRTLRLERTFGRPMPAVMDAQGQLDVLLQHRPCSIPRESAAFHAKRY